jgi:hypothetical protein
MFQEKILLPSSASKAKQSRLHGGFLATLLFDPEDGSGVSF